MMYGHIMMFSANDVWWRSALISCHAFVRLPWIHVALHSHCLFHNHIILPLTRKKEDQAPAFCLEMCSVTLSSCLIQIPITHAFHAIANRDGHIGRGDLADRTNKY